MQLQPLRAMQFGFGVALAVLLGVGAVAYRSVIAANESKEALAKCMLPIENAPVIV